MFGILNRITKDYRYPGTRVNCNLWATINPLNKNNHTRFLLVTLFLFGIFHSQTSSAQTFIVRGTVYDSSRNYPLEAVSVLSTSGRGTATSSDGRYEIEV